MASLALAAPGFLFAAPLNNSRYLACFAIHSFMSSFQLPLTVPGSFYSSKGVLDCGSMSTNPFVLAILFSASTYSYKALFPLEYALIFSRKDTGFVTIVILTGFTLVSLKMQTRHSIGQISGVKSRT